MPWTSLARIPASAGRKQNLRGAVARVGSARRDEVSNSGRQRLDPEPKGRAGSTGPGRARRRPRGTHLARKAHDTGSLICPMNRAASAVGEAANSSATARTTHAVTDRVRPNLRACPIASEGLRNEVLVARYPRARLGPRGYLASAVEPRLVARARRVVSAGRGEASSVVMTHYLRTLFFRPGTTEISLLRPLG